jgi:protein arginine N-methyltransferase 7
MADSSPPVPPAGLSKSQKKRLKKKRAKAARSAEKAAEKKAHAEREPEEHQPSWYPPGADAHRALRESGEERVTEFQEEFEPHFHVASRIAERNSELIEAVNDFHFAMMNDTQRNEFYQESLRKVITPESVVVEIGTGSGLLAMICARLGAKHVYAIEANSSLAKLARANARANGLDHRITIVNKMSTEVRARDLPHGKADVLVSEILGTLLLSESALEYNEDARKRLLKPGAAVIPRRGTQHVTLVSCPQLRSITTVSGWGGIDFSRFNALKDTSSLLFTKQVGCRFNAMDYARVTERLPVVSVDFAEDEHASHALEKRIRCRALRSGVVDAAIFSWEVTSPGRDGDGRPLQMTTHAEDTLDNFPRDMQWGQGLQLVDDHVASERLFEEDCAARGDGCTPSVPLELEEGEEIDVVIKFAEDGVLMQCLVERIDGDGRPVGLPLVDEEQ